MSEENKTNQSISSQSVEDVFSSVEEVSNTPTSQESEKKSVDILESSLGQDGTVSPTQKEEVVSGSMLRKDVEEKNKSLNTGKILFYFILSLIILLGAFAIWALVF